MSKQIERGRLTVLPRHAHLMGYMVAVMLKRGEHVAHPDNPFSYYTEKDNHFAWANGYALGCDAAQRPRV